MALEGPNGAPGVRRPAFDTPSWGVRHVARHGVGTPDTPEGVVSIPPLPKPVSTMVPVLRRAVCVGVAGASWGQGARADTGDDPAGLPVEEVVVTAPDEGPVPVGVTRVDPAAVARPGDGVEDVLASVPGVRIRRLGGLGAFAGISLRGSGFRHTLVRLDGVPLNPDGVEAVDLSRWPLAGLAQIDVTRGRPAATVGAAPVGGVVDLWTGQGAGSASAEVSAASFGTVRGHGTVAASGARGDGLLAVDALQTAGRFQYLDDGGTRYLLDDDRIATRDNADRRQLSGLVRGRLGDPSARGTVLVSAAHREEGLPGPIGIPWASTRLRTDRVLASLGGDGQVGSGTMAGRAWSRWRGQQLRDPDGELGGRPSLQRDRYAAAGAQVSGQGALHPVVALRGSLDARVETFARRVDADLAPTQQAERLGVGAALDLPVRPRPWLEVVPGIDVRGLWTLGSEDDGVVAVLPGLVVRGTPEERVGFWLSGTGAFRPPDLTELYGDEGSLKGNPDLRPERAWKAEAGVRAAGAAGGVRGAVETAVFGTWARDAIGWLQNTQRTLVAVNFGRTRTVGGELGGALSWRDLIGIQASLTVMDARQTTDDPTRRGRPVPFAAPWQAWGRVWTQPAALLRLGIDLEGTAAVPVDPQGVERLPSRALLGVFASLDVGDTGWSLSLDVDNLLGVRTGRVDRDPLGADDTRIDAPIVDVTGYPLPGRTWRVGVRWTIPAKEGA